MTHVYLCVQKSEEDMGSLVAGVTEDCEQPKSISLEKKQVLLTDEPSSHSNLMIC